jgi:hypothetical protein
VENVFMMIVRWDEDMLMKLGKKIKRYVNERREE